jgi:hypothetical protein
MAHCSIIRNKETQEIERVNAPNGKESFLYNSILALQPNKEEALKFWAQVYTPSFKEWFGDWENSPSDASKVVDENGEPLLVYHGSDSPITTFEIRREPVFHFGTKAAATQRGSSNVHPVFLNTRNTDINTDNMHFAGKIADDLVKNKRVTEKEIYGVDSIDDEYNRITAEIRKANETLPSSEWLKIPVIQQVKSSLAVYNAATQINRLEYYLDYAQEIFNSYVKELLSKKGIANYGYSYINFSEDPGSTSYVVFSPNQIKSVFNQGTYSQEDNNIYNQAEDVPASIASPDTIAKVKEACAKMGISIQALSEYVKNNPNVNTKGINGLADIVKGIIALSEGRENTTLTEEMVHIATSILEQISPKFVTEMISKIERFAIYKQVYEAYKGKYKTIDGKPDIRKIKKEAVDKLIAELIINNNENTTEFPELMEEQNRNLVKQWWENILDWFRGQYRKTNIDIFNVAAERVMEGNINKYNGITISLGRNIQREFGLVQNIIISYKGKEITSQDGTPGLGEMNIVINNDEIIVGNIRLPKEYQGKGLTKYIYQAIADKLQLPIINSKDKGYNQSESGGYIWKNRTSFQPTAPKEQQEEGIYYQIEKNEAVDRMYNIYREKEARIGGPFLEETDSSGKVIKKRHYTFDGKEVARSVTEKTKASNKMPERTPAQLLDDNQKRDWGLAGHAFIENDIAVNLIDKDGYAREVFLDEKINSPLDEEITDKLKAFNRELIRSYPKGTRFLVELKVINEKEKGLLASTVDFKAIEPTPDGKDFRIDTLDWKFMNINKEHEEDVPWYKQKDWKPQMGEYSKMDREYGVTSKQIRKARMIPFQMNYEYRKTKSKEKVLYATSIEIGDLDNMKETHLYLLPVPTDIESTGSEKIDALVTSLDMYYEKLAKMPVSPLEKDIKKGQLTELSKAIRVLRMKMGFEPLANVGITFLKNAKKVLDTLSNVDYSTMSQKDINKKLAELLEFKKSAEKFASLDKVFLSYYPKNTLDEKGREILTTLRSIAGATDVMLEDIVDLQKEYAVQFALIEGITNEENKLNILEPEKEIGGFYRMLSEASLLSSKIINIATNYILNKRGETNILVEKETKRFGTLLLALENVARAKGKSAFNLIAKIKDNEFLLHEKVDKEFLNELSKAQQEKNKAFLLENLNLEAYKKLAQEVITKQNEIIEDTHYSSDDRDNEERKTYEKEKIKNALSIESKAFNGYTNGTFNRIYRLTMKADEHLSESYKEMAKDKAILDMWEFLTELNQKAIEMGYLSYGKSSFFALIEATMIQKLRASDNMLEEASDMFKDLYSVRINEEHSYSKLDKETGQIKRVIPKLFTRTDKAVNQLSQDLTMVGPLWIKSLYEYQASVDMELPLLTLLEVERNKDHIIVEKGNIVSDESGKPRIGRGNTNAEILATQIDDVVYGLKEDTSSLGNVVISQGANAVSANEEVAETRAVNIRKGIENMNALTQSLAVGLRWMVMIPNYFGNQFQSFINNGKLYTYKEFLANHGKMITGINLTTIQKGLIDLIVPLNGDPYMEARRKIAWKQGFGKWLGTWTMQEAMMSTNYLPERNLQFTNALSFIDNAMVVDGKIVNIRQHLSRQDESRYKKDENGKFIMSQEERKAYEKTFNERVKALKDSSSLDKIATIENDEVIIPGVSNKELAKFRTQIVEWGRNLNGQMSQENKAGYRRDILLKSFAMFRNWIIRQSAIRGHDITYNTEINDWEYGRTRAFMKAWIQACNWNIMKMQAIMNGTDEGLAIMDEMLTRKKEEYYKKNGKVLEITNEQFYDMMRIALSNEMKELGTLLGLMTVVIGAKLAAPPPDEDILTRNKYKYFLKLMNKITDEVRFYYSPVSFLSMTRGSFLPALGLIGKAQKAITALGTETIGYVTDNEKLMKDTHTAKYFLDIIPVASQFQRDWLPLIDPEFAKEMGIVVTAQPRIQQ